MMDDDPTPPSDPEHSALTVERLTECQGRLFAYIYSLTADPETARDVLQETNRQLWRRAAEYDPGREFLPWALAHAFNQVRAARSKAQRERLVFQEEKTLQTLSEQAENHLAARRDGDREIALEECLHKLTTKQRRLVERFYDRGESMLEIAESEQRRENTVAVSLHRIRQSLADCIRLKLRTS